MTLTGPFLICLTLLTLGCSSVSDSLTRVPASNNSDELAALLEPYVETFSRPVKMYHWSNDSVANIPQYTKHHLDSSTIVTGAISTASGLGLYAAIDPGSTSVYGKNILVLDIPQGFRFLRSDAFARDKKFIAKLKNLGMTKWLFAARNSTKEQLELTQNALEKLQVDGIRYSFFSNVKKHSYAFVLMNPAVKDVTYYHSNKTSVNKDYKKCTEEETCAIGIGHYEEDK
jgi:hypothetical protein